MAQVERIRDALRRQPFRPFSVKLVDGTVYSVQHPDWVSIPPVRRPRDVTVYTVEGNGAGDDYETHWIDLGLILEVIGSDDTTSSPATPKSEGNGE